MLIEFKIDYYYYYVDGKDDIKFGVLKVETQKKQSCKQYDHDNNSERKFAIPYVGLQGP